MKPLERDVKAVSILALILVAATIAGAEAQTYPSRPITLIARPVRAGRRTPSGAFWPNA
jgi:tripartite-type tricarboxylate transporter receptor subunit TctC